MRTIHAGVNKKEPTRGSWYYLGVSVPNVVFRLRLKFSSSSILAGDIMSFNMASVGLMNLFFFLLLDLVDCFIVIMLMVN